jgi:hypothetical protein
MDGHLGLDIGDGDGLAGECNPLRGGALLQKFAQTNARCLFVDAKELAAPDMVREHRQPCRLDGDKQNEARPAVRRLPERRITLEGREGSLEIFVGDHAQHVIGSVKALFHPAIDVAAAFDLPFVDVCHMAKRRELLADPMSPVTIAAGVGDEKIGH